MCEYDLPTQCRIKSNTKLSSSMKASSHCRIKDNYKIILIYKSVTCPLHSNALIHTCMRD